MLRSSLFVVGLLAVLPMGRAGEPSVVNAGDHWAFRPPYRGAIPVVAKPLDAHNPIDAFVAAAYEERRLQPVSLADKRLLLRRLFLDLVGLPPSLDALRRFEKDARPDAYERAVDRLLGSPHYGERWGRHWMDVWRYTDWYGLDGALRNGQPHIWHWRDWIVESLNADKGYDRMVLEMLAADEIAPTDRDALRATGFLARNYYLFNRTTWLDDTIEHTSKAFLGLTMNCVKCHEHKFDHFDHTDYYRLRAIFEPHQIRTDALPGEPDLGNDGLPRIFDAKLDAPTYVHLRGDWKQPDTSRVIEPGVPKLLAFRELDIRPISLPLEAYRPAIQSFPIEDQLDAAEEAIQRAVVAVAEAEKRANDDVGLNAARATLAAAKLRPDALRTAYAVAVAREKRPGAARAAGLEALTRKASEASKRYELAAAEAELARAKEKLAAADDKTKKVHEKNLEAAQKRLEKARAASEVQDDAFTPLRASEKAADGPDETEESRRSPYPSTSSGRRTAFAKWIVDRRNPLAARVAANHIWLRHLGQPIVKTVSDFGRRAKKPVHQDLLDWLAVELIESGWRMKDLHRRIVTSRTYRLSGASVDSVDEVTRQKDPDNEFYWCRRPVRMESEVIRDSLLSLAGELDPMIGGPTIDPKKKETSFRRSLYFTHSRDDQHAFLSMFDDADILRCYRRSESVVPQQALALANSELALGLARRLARRLEAENPGALDDRFVEVAFETILARPPTGEERAACCDAIEATKQVLFETEPVTRARRARENLVHSLLNHNDFISIR